MNIAFDYQTQLNNPDWNVVKGFLGTGLGKNFTNIQVGYETQHNTDDTHGAVTADSLIVAGLTTIQQQLSANGSVGVAGQLFVSGGNTANAAWSSSLGNTTITGTLTANGPFVLKSTLSANGATGSLYQVLGANSAANAYWTMGTSGTWTPTDGSGAALSFSVTGATYLRIGGLVYVNAVLAYPSTSDATAAQINGLPFTEASGINSGLALTFQALTSVVDILIVASSTHIFPFINGSRATNVGLSGQTLEFSGIYRAA